MSAFKIGDYLLNGPSGPLIIAELSGNHNQSLDKALQIVDAAALAGANAVKLQTYTPDTMTINKSDGDFFISDKKSLWSGESLYSLYSKAYTPWEWHGPIFERCQKHGMLGFSTPFDITAVDFLEDLNVPCHKIASFEIVDLPLIRRVAQTGKPIIMSTGMATLAEIDDAVRCARHNGCKNLVLLQCTSSYPADPSNSNIKTIPHMKQLFDCEVGLSDHTLGIGAAVASVALGACVIEKHLTLDRSEGGVDSAFSLEPDEFARLVSEAKVAALALGSISYGPSESELKSLKFRRSLYFVADLAAGDIISHQNVRSIRPSSGIAPKFLDLVIGKKVSRDVTRGQPLTWDCITN